MTDEIIYIANIRAKKDFHYKMNYIEPERVIKRGEQTYIDFRSGSIVGTWLLNCDGVLAPFSYSVLVEYLKRYKFEFKKNFLYYIFTIKNGGKYEVIFALFTLAKFNGGR